MLWGLLGVAFAQTHRVQFVEVSTELPLVVEVTCNERQRRPAGWMGISSWIVLCETIYIHSPYHHRSRL